MLKGTKVAGSGPTPVAEFTYTREMVIRGRPRGTLLGPAVGTSLQKKLTPAQAYQRAAQLA